MQYSTGYKIDVMVEVASVEDIEKYARFVVHTDDICPTYTSTSSKNSNIVVTRAAITLGGAREKNLKHEYFKLTQPSTCATFSAAELPLEGSLQTLDDLEAVLTKVCILFPPTSQSPSVIDWLMTTMHTFFFLHLA